MGPEDAGAEFFDLGTAETTDDLRRVLVLYPPVRRAANAWSTTSSSTCWPRAFLAAENALPWEVGVRAWALSPRPGA